MGGCCCPSNPNPFSPILFFATSSETPLTIPVNTPVDVLTLGVSPPSPGQHQVKIDSTVELIITQLPGNTLSYDISYRLQKDGTTIAELQIAKTYITPTNTSRIHTEIPNLTWNDVISTSSTYTVEIQISPTGAFDEVVVQTRALNAIVF